VIGFLDPGGGGDIGELPGVRLRSGAIVPEEQFGPSQQGDMQVGAPIIVEVPEGGPLGEAIDPDPGAHGHLGERSIPVVVEQFAGMPSGPIRHLVPHEDVHPAIPVEVEPDRGLVGVERQQSCGRGDILEGSISAVAEQGVRIDLALPHPSARQHMQVDVSVVVVVGRHHMESAGEAWESRLGRAIDKGTVAVVAEVPEGVRQADGGHHDVEQSITVAILDRNSAGESLHRRSHGAGEVDEASGVMSRGEGCDRDHRRRRNTLGMVAKGHGHDVQKTAGGEVVRVLRSKPGPDLEGRLAAILLRVAPVSFDRQQAGLAGGVAETVPQLALSEVGQRLVQTEVHDILSGRGQGGGLQQPIDLREGPERRLVLTGLEAMDPKRELEGHQFCGIPVCDDLALQGFRLRDREKRIPGRRDPPSHLLEQRHHFSGP